MKTNRQKTVGGVAGLRSPFCLPRQAGQAMLESCLVIACLCLLLFGVMQVAQVFLAAEIMDHAAAFGARARAVGFNDFMVHKVTRVATIPVAGQMTSPGFVRNANSAQWGSRPIGQLWDIALKTAPISPQFDTESSRIPLYLGAQNYGELSPVLDYADWDTVRYPSVLNLSATEVRSTMSQAFPLRWPMVQLFYADDSVNVRGYAAMDSHYTFYLEP